TPALDSNSDDQSQYRVKLTYTDTMIYSSPATLTVYGIATTGQPVSQTANVGGYATFAVIATGTPTYQWQECPGSARGVCSPSGTPWVTLSGANSNSYTTGKLTSADDQDTFQVVLTYSQGTVTSNPVTPATLSVNYITTQPLPQINNQGLSATCSVTPNNQPTTYQ